MFWKVADGKATLQQSLVNSTDLSAKWASIRSQRNTKLAESDYMSNSDVTMSSAWKTYRQALREIYQHLNLIQMILLGRMNRHDKLGRK